MAFPERVKTLVLESASPGLAEEAERQARIERDEVLARRIESQGLVAFVDFWENIPLFDSQKQLASEVQKALRAERLSQTEAGLSSSLRGMGTGAQPSLWHHLEELACPVLLITGAYDPKFVRINTEMEAEIPNPQLDIVPQSGHAIHVEFPSVFGKILSTFLEQHT
ncbi:2-succinyl-6-hydroxy-2,4-cyclohexadiene-1-carboxylate synthase [Lentibacillus sp. JNUCC-1]|nr:2-succinyl-6-hydroxy-2,4-cyclohexadiene-1-carboxylate synthase [Lentibacillus sp. JNUCC-1]